MADSLSGLGLLSSADLFDDLNAPVSKPKNPGLLARAGQILSGVPGGVMQLGSDIARLPLAGTGGDFGKRYPAIFGMGQGFQTTAKHLNPLDISQTIKDYQDDGLGMLINDVGNIATVASLGAGGLAKAGLTAGGGITGAGGAAGARAATIAGRLEKIAAAGNKVADIPMVPYRFALTRATEAAGRHGLRAAEAGSTSALHRGLVRFSPEGKALNNALLTGAARENHTPLLRAEVRAETSQAIGDLPFARQADEVLSDPERGARRADSLEEMAAAASSRAKTAKSVKAQNRYEEKAAGLLSRANEALGDSGPSKFVAGDGQLTLREASGGRLGRDEATTLSKPLAGEVGRFFQDASELPLAKGLNAVLSPTNRLHRMFRLSMNPGWAVGQGPGNAVMTAVGASHPLDAIRRGVRKSISGDYGDMPARTNRTALEAVRQEAAEATPKITQADGLLGRVGGAVGKLDDWAKRAEGRAAEGLPLGRTVEKGGKGRRISLPAIADRLDSGFRAGFVESEMVRGGASKAVAEETMLKHMGEFDKKNLIESAYASKLSPFYTWNREIVKMTAAAAERHPVGALQAASLGATEADKPEPEAGARKIDGGFLIPFGQTGNSFGGTLFGAGKQLGPLPKLLAMAGTGNNMSTGKDLRVGQEFGESNTPGLHNIAAAWSTIFRNYPLARTLTAVKGENRYQTPEETLLSLSGVEVSHAPTEEQLAEEKASRASDRQDNKIRALTEAAKSGR